MTRRGLHIHVLVKLFACVLLIILEAVSGIEYRHAVFMAALCVFAMAQGYLKQTLMNVLLFGVFTGGIFLYTYFNWSDDIVSRYALILARNAMPVFFALHLLALTPPSEISAALDGLYFPKTTGVVIVTLFRYFPTVGTEINCIRENMRIRGIGGFRRGAAHPFRLLTYMLLPLLVRALNVGEELSISAVSRGAESPVRRHSFYEKPFAASDGFWLFLFLTGGLCFLFFPGPAR
ncbi:MAG: energy-coupling factor transporter transmembrane protein EcfT [Treponema sp.]|jgi:energy-coupling factor transport system permease protein|nr:energy-coupling factor transporter transmembrane protein EcfT [Treponema sp.]